MQQTTWEKEDRQPALQRLSPAQDQGEQRLAVNAFLTEHWGSTVMMVRGEQVDMSRLPGIFVEEQSQITALLTYRIQGERCEIISLDSVIGGRGVGTALIEGAVAIAQKAGCRTLAVTTTNDNLNALRFYQKRGFVLAALYPGSVERARRQKPQIPEVGEFGIPLNTEIELERMIVSGAGQAEPAPDPRPSWCSKLPCTRGWELLLMTQ